MRKLLGTVYPPADKSIAHRAILFSLLSRGTSRIQARGLGRDTLASLRATEQLGAGIAIRCDKSSSRIIAEEGLSFDLQDEPYISLEILGRAGACLQPEAPIDCGNSGTTSRLLCGLLAGQTLEVTLFGDESLSRRPFKRVCEPLEIMGAQFSADMLPLTVRGGKLKALTFHSPRASAQVKTAILLAGLQAEGQTRVSEPSQSRDHSERMLKAMGAHIEESLRSDGRWEVSLEPRVAPLSPLSMSIPGDLSSAAFFIVLASVLEGSEIELHGVSVNPSRRGILDLLLRMGANISEHNVREESGEPVADLHVRGSSLQGIEVSRRDTVLAIDEIPILSVAASMAKGDTIIRGAEELRVKESDRLAMTAALLESFGREVEELPDGLIVKGSPDTSSLSWQPQVAEKWLSCHDHRIFMAAAVLRYLLSGSVEVDSPEVVETSYPDFIKHFQILACGADSP